MFNSPLQQQFTEQINPESQPYSTKRTIITIVALTLLFFTVIITIAILQPLLSHSAVAPLTSGAASQLDSTALTKLESTIKDQVSSSYNLSDKQLDSLSIVIRESTIESTTNETGSSSLTFLVDLNDPLVTYQVTYYPAANSTVLYCPPISLTQDPNTFCYGTDGRSTITANLSRYLPYQGTTSSDIDFSVSHRAEDLASDPYLTIYASVCDDDSAAAEVESTVKNWIRSKGIPNPDIIPLHFPHSYCNDRD